MRHGVVVEKIHESISLKQSKRLEKKYKFYIQNWNTAKNEFEKDF